jgi:hypothetical protein
MLGKQANYSSMADEMKPVTVLSKQFQRYFKIPQSYQVNQDYNFIPYMLLNFNSRLVKNLLSKNWINTQYGLFKPGKDDSVVPIIEPRKSI